MCVCVCVCVCVCIHPWICGEVNEIIRIQSWFAIKQEKDAVAKWIVIQIQKCFMNFKVLKLLLQIFD